MVTLLHEFGPLYTHAAVRGVDAVALDRCELWQVAWMFGVGQETVENGQPSASAPRVAGDALLRRRIAAAKGEAAAPAPVTAAPPSETLAKLRKG